jgi:hypothetical protein
MTRFASDPRLVGSRMKVGRANAHIDELDAAIAAGRGRDYGVGRETQAAPAAVIFRARVDHVAMSRYGVVVGDVVHNLRSALDHAVWQLVLSNGGAPDRRTVFPILRSTREYQERGRAALHGVSPTAESFVEAVQPFHTPDETLAPEASFLWVLNEMSNWDKHRVINVTAARIAGWTVTMTGGLTRNFVSAGMPNPAAFGPVEDGEVMHVIDPGSDIAMDPDYEIKLGIAFAEGGPGRGQFAIPLLRGFSERVSTILDGLERYIES